MKKWIFKLVCVLLALIMLAGCGGSSTGSSGSTSGSSGSSGGSSGSSGGSSTPSGGGGGTTSSPGTIGSASSTGGSEAMAALPENANLAEHIDIILNETQLTVINPMLLAGSGGPSSWTYTMIYDNLLEKTGPGKVGPRLAYEYSTDDYKTFIFKLRDDVYWHNGDHFTADDVIWFINLVKATPTSQGYSLWNRVETMNAPDPYTVEITLHEMYVDFYNSVAGAAILNRRSYEANPNEPGWAMVGTGPFKVTAFSSNDYATLERNDDYWGEAPPTKSVTFWTIPEMSTRIVMLQNKEAQVSFQMTPEDLDILDADPDYQVFPVMINEPVIIGFNDQGDAIMKDLNFRLAVAHALNYDDVAMVALGSWARAPWDGNFWGPDTEYRLEGLPTWTYDPALAKEYLAKSVYKGETIDLITTSAHNIRASELIQLNLEAVGIKINVIQTDHAGLVSALAPGPDSKAQMHLFSMAMQHTMSNVLAGGFTSPTNNRLNYANPYVYNLENVYNATPDTEKRKAMAVELQEFFHETVPAIPAFWRVQAVVAVKGIGGITLSSNQFDHNMRGIYWNLDETPARLRP